MNVSRIVLATAVGLVAASATGFGTTYTASSVAQVNSLVSTVAAGSTIMIANGIYDSGTTSTASQQEIDLNPPAGGPITLAAATPGEVIFKGATQIHLGNKAQTNSLAAPLDGVTVNGLVFDQANASYNGPGAWPVIMVHNVTGARVTECAFVASGNIDQTNISGQRGTKGTFDHLIQVLEGSLRTRIDHNYFQASASQNISVTDLRPDILGAKQGAGSGPALWIDHNYYKDIECIQGNGGETLQVGQGGCTDNPLQLVAEYNLEDDSFGNFEYMSIKQSDSLVRYNTFTNLLVNSYTGLCARSGEDNTFEGNFFVNDQAGMTLFGADQLAVNNYFEDIYNPYFSSAQGVITLPTGLSSAPNAYLKASLRSFVINNTVINLHNESSTSPGQATGILIGSAFGTVAPQGPGILPYIVPNRPSIYNNIVESPAGTMIGQTAWASPTFLKNITYPTSATASAGYTTSGVTVEDPSLTLSALTSEDIYRLESTSAARGTADGSWWVPRDDMDGESRTSPYDVGADQYFSTTSNPVRRVLTAADVGPSWINGLPIEDSLVIWGPTTASAAVGGPTYANLTWAPTDPLPAAGQGYQYRYHSDTTPWAVNESFHVSGSLTTAYATNLAPNHTYYLQVTGMQSDGTRSAWSPVAQVTLPDGYAESSSSGVSEVVTETEDDVAIYNHSATPSAAFTLQTVTDSPAGVSGIGCMVAGTTFPTTWTDSVGMDYNVLFNDNATYNVWVRAYANDGFSDSFRYGWNGSEGSDPSLGVSVPTTGSWVWVNCGTYTATTAPAMEQFSVRRREGGTRVDKIVITTSAITPSGVADGESAPVLLPALSLSSNVYGQPARQMDVTTSAATYTLTVSASGNPAPTYQWYLVTYDPTNTISNAVWTPVSSAWGSGSTSAACTLTASAAPSGYYAVAMTNLAGTATSTPFDVGFYTTPSSLSALTAAPSATISPGAELTLTMSANVEGSGTTAALYRNGVKVTGATVGAPSVASSTISPVYFFTPQLYPGNYSPNLTTGTYSIVLTAPGGGTATSSPVWLTVNSATDTQSPVFTTQPASTMSGINTPITLSATVTGATSYQWYRNGVALATGTSSSYVIPASSPPDLIENADLPPYTGTPNFLRGAAGTYKVVAYNSFGAATSSPAVVFIQRVQGQPISRTVATGGDAFFAITPDGWVDDTNGSLVRPSIQWYHNGTAVSGSAGAGNTLILHSVGSGDQGTVSAQLTLDGFTFTSAAATLTVSP